MDAYGKRWQGSPGRRASTLTDTAVKDMPEHPANLEPNCARDNHQADASTCFSDSPRNTAEYWKLTRLPKYSSTGVVRSIEPRETIRRARNVMQQAGITRIAEVTGLDRVGIPNFISVRPRDLDPGISYYNGKGTTRDDAQAGALMEAIERHAGEFCDYTVVAGSYDELRDRYECVRPNEIIVPAVVEFSGDLILEWVCGYDVLRGRETLVPLNAVICPYRPRRGSTLFYASTNGLASGNTRIEALCHAICEVIERDAQAICGARAQIRPLVRGLLGVETPIDHQNSRIRLDSLPARAEVLIERLKRAGLSVYLRNLTSTAGIPAIDCTIVEHKNDGAGDAYGGCGAHPDARVALLRAITEAAQSRITCIQGGREDLPQIMRHKTFREIDDLFSSGDWISFRELPTFEHACIDQDVELLVSRLPEYGLDQLVAFDMTRPDVGIPVVRVVVPKAETWPVFHLHTGRGTFGPRIAQDL
jgi:YcaO-like protein with predicted kinase domain